MCSQSYKKSGNQTTMHCSSMLWIGSAALLLTVVQYLAHRRENMAQRQVEVKNADSMETKVDEMSNATKRKLTTEKAIELAAKIR